MLVLLLVAILAGFDCSCARSEYGARIYNGHKAERGQFPYQAMLLQDTYKNTTEFCGGALISLNHVLTAAHCSHQTYRTHVYLGVLDNKDGAGVVSVTVDSSNTVVHPHYNPSNFQNDIAILNLPQRIRLSDHIQTIALPKRGWAPPATFDNYEVTASGWGQTYDTENGIHQSLEYNRVYVMPHSECISYYANTLPITDGMICTDKNRVYSGPCRGDSGGPLTVSLRSGLYLMGIVSWSTGACSEAQPIVYANVAHYLPWISSITGISIS